MPQLILIHWRDIPAQAIVRSGRAVVKRELPARFAEAIDMAAMRGAAKDSDAYLAAWKRAEPVEVEGDPEAILAAEIARLDGAYDDARLAALARAGGEEAAVAREHLVVFSPSGKRGRFAAGTSLLDAARALGVDLDSVCGGRGICGRCQCRVEDGVFAKHGITSAPGHVTPENDTEARYRAKRGAPAPGLRLGCQARLAGDVAVDVPPEFQLHRQVIRKAADERAIEIDPVVTLHYVEVAEPDMHDARGDATRLREALQAQWGLGAIDIPLPVLAGLQQALRKGEWRVTCAVRAGGTVVAIHPGLVESVAGVAVDIGSTTIAAHLCDLATGRVLASAGVMNPQIRFGEDLMSRVSYVMLNPGGREELTAAVRGALDDLVGELAREAGIERALIAEMTIVANPVMHHLALGLDPTELGGAPFALALDAAIDIPARDLGLVIAPGAFAHVLPCIAGHVGADAAGMILAEAPHLADEPTLLVDVGTNAEIVLGDRTRVLACSSPTGPAFEGAQITAGQRAAPGAIERIRIDRETLEPRYKVIGCDLWSDDPGFEAATAKTGVTGICGSGIIEAIAELFLAGVIRSDGMIDGALVERTPRLREEYRSHTYLIRDGAPRIAITQHDVRAIQLAKAALHAGATLLMERWGLTRVGRVKLAGAFGSHIDPVHALVLGLVPDCAPERVTAVGNAAGAGARVALLNAAARTEIAEVARRVEKIETAIEPGFQAAFVAAMGLPHASDPYEELAKVVALPERKAPERGRRRRG
jgi:uncharacterized 2Fe-2S/4Fe-4S cluster protein (DUF4445 family)